MNTRAELAAAAAVLRDRINHAHMLAGATIVDPATTWIDPTVELEPDCTIQPVHRAARLRRASPRGAEVGPHVVAVDAGDRPRRAGRPLLLPSPRNGARDRREGGRVRGDQELAHRGTHEGAAPVLHRRRRDRRGHQHRGGQHHGQLPAPARQPKGRTTIGRNVRTGVHNAFVAPVEIGDDAWIGAGSVITEDVPPESLAVARARQENKEGYVRRKREQED